MIKIPLFNLREFINDKKTHYNIFIHLPLFLLLSVNTSYSQELRYFQFTTECGHGNWQDTAFIAATSDSIVIASVLEELEKPIRERKFIAGPIDYGDGGVNRNASHWFSWHFIPNEWELVEQAIEVCDGCPYTDLDSDTAYWVGNIGSYCPWSGAPVREVNTPVNVNDPNVGSYLKIYPNPASEYFYVENSRIAHSLALYTTNGTIAWKAPNVHKQLYIVDVRNMQDGIYLLHWKAREQNYTQKILISKP